MNDDGATFLVPMSWRWTGGIALSMSVTTQGFLFLSRWSTDSAFPPETPLKLWLPGKLLSEVLSA